MNISETLREPILHAVQTCDKALLNRIELEIVRDLGIQPSELVTENTEGESCEKWTAVGIASVGRELAVLWISKTEVDCGECDGSGTLRAHGNKRTYEMECPACDGFGHTDEGVEHSCWTDIDGEKLTITPPPQDEVPQIIGTHLDPLHAYYKHKNEQTKDTK